MMGQDDQARIQGHALVGRGLPHPPSLSSISGGEGEACRMRVRPRVRGMGSSLPGVLGGVALRRTEGGWVGPNTILLGCRKCSYRVVSLRGTADVRGSPEGQGPSGGGLGGTPNAPRAGGWDQTQSFLDAQREGCRVHPAGRVGQTQSFLGTQREGCRTHPAGASLVHPNLWS